MRLGSTAGRREKAITSWCSSCSSGDCGLLEREISMTKVDSTGHALLPNLKVNGDDD